MKTIVLLEMCQVDVEIKEINFIIHKLRNITIEIKEKPIRFSEYKAF